MFERRMVALYRAANPESGWRTISGTRLAINVQLVVVGQNLNAQPSVRVNGRTKSARRHLDGLLLNTACTHWNRRHTSRKMPQEIFAVIEKCILTRRTRRCCFRCGGCRFGRCSDLPKLQVGLRSRLQILQYMRSKALIRMSGMRRTDSTQEAQFCAQCGKSL